MNIFSQLLGASRTDTPAILGSPDVATLGDVLRDAEALAKALRSVGLQPNEPVGLWLPMSRALVASVLGVRSVGCVYSVFGIRATSFELSRDLAQLGCRFVVTTASIASRVDGLALAQQGTWGDCVIVAPQLTVAPSRFSSHDACVIFTSGSTARPKGVVLTDSCISSNAYGVGDFTCLSARDRSVVFTPPQFAFAQSQILSHLVARAPFLPWPSGVGPHDHLWRSLKDADATGVSANPSSFELLLNAAGRGAALATLRYVVSAGQPLLSSAVGRLRVAFPNARIASCFGCTENTLRATYYWVPGHENVLPTVLPVGRPIRGTSVSIVDEHGTDLPPMAHGVVRISGQSLMRGYMDLLRDGDDAVSFFDTDDLGYIDVFGDLHLTGRVSARLNVGNEKVSPEEVESVIASVDGVLECAVGPLKDELLGEVPAAMLVLTDISGPEDVTRAAQMACERLLSRAKRPKYFFLVERSTIPRTEYGKLSRRQLPGVLAALKDVRAKS